MRKIICLLLSLCLLSLGSVVVIAQTSGCTDPATGGPVACPDRDGDGVQDSQDRCISDVGPASNGGCPETGQTGGGSSGDADGDGISDTSDQCATIAGTADFGGCPGPTATPIPDSDADGEHDLIDRCPNQPGPATNTGCPLETSADPLATARPTEAGSVRPVFPPSESCLVEMKAQNNLKQMGLANAPVVETIPATEFAAATSAVINADGEKWFYIEPRGYVPARSVFTNGKCEDLPTKETHESLVFTANEGPCQVMSSIRVNVRVEPSLNAAVASSLLPGQFYPVLGAVLNVEGTWYRVETGWVSASVVVIDGQCAPAPLMFEASVFTIDQTDDDSTAGGIAPEKECFVLFKGLNFCQFILTATANEDGSTEGWAPGGTNVCGIGIGGVGCTLIEFNSYTPEECEPELCGGGDPEPQLPPEPYPDGPHPLVQEDDGLDLSAGSDTDTPMACKTLFDRLALPTKGENSPYIREDLPGGVRFGLHLPPLEPQPCLVDVYVVRHEQAANGQTPVDRMTLELEFPPSVAAYDFYLQLDGIPGETSDSQPAPSATLYNLVRIDPDGTTCITVTHGDFKWCPGQSQPTAP